MQASRPPLSTARIIAVCRQLLREGGPPAVVMREVARRLDVTAPALYKHAQGRDALLTLLISACHDEVGAVCERARADVDPLDAPEQLRATTMAFRAWAIAHPPEFALLYGQPIVGYSAPVDGPTTHSAQRFGLVFSAIYRQLLRDGRLRTPSLEDLPAGFAASVKAGPLAEAPELPATVMYQFVKGFQRMLGLVSVEVAGHLSWAMEDTEAFAARQIEDLTDELVAPDPAAGHDKPAR